MLKIPITPADIGMSDAEFSRRAAEERTLWSRDQYAGNLDARRKQHKAMWEDTHRFLGHEAGALPNANRNARLRICVIGCGHGGVEWDVAETYPNAVIDAVDLSTPESAPLRDTARIYFKNRITYLGGYDAQFQLPGEGYDFIVAMSVLHHMPYVEGCVATISRCLKPGGSVLLSEFVGGRGISCTPQRQRVAQRIWDALPIEYRRRSDGWVQPGPPCYSAEGAAGFESICTERIVPAFRASDLQTVTEKFTFPLRAYRLILGGQRSVPTNNEVVDRLLAAFEDVLMTEGWLEGEDWHALLRKPPVHSAGSSRPGSSPGFGGPE